MSASRKPLRITPERFAELLVPDPAAEFGWRWRARQPSDFGGDERSCAIWNGKHASRAVGKRESRDGRGGRVTITIDGANLDLRRIIAELGEAIDAIVSSSEGTPHTFGTADCGPLASIFVGAVRKMGKAFDAFTVLSSANDPYRCDTPARRRDAEWFAEHFLDAGAKHLRGFHYKLIGQATKPNGALYTGAFGDWQWLNRTSMAARWLGLVPFEDFEDRRASEPIIHRDGRARPGAITGVRAHFGAEPPSVEVTEGEDGEIDFYPTLEGMTAEQPYVLAIFGEKSSLAEEVTPIAVGMGADLYLETGEQSVTHTHDIAARAVDDGRPLIVLTVADCDPSGYQMSVSIARKLQALRDLKFPSLDFDVIHVGLTPDQARSFRLPSSPLSENEMRKARWRERMGVEQTEVDSLLALHPGALARLVRDALAPYFDPTLPRRVREAELLWRAEANDIIQESLDPDGLAEIEGRAQDVSARIAGLGADIERVEQIRDRIDDEAAAIRAEVAAIDQAMAGIADEIDLDPPDIPEAELPDRPTDGPNMVLSSAWTWVEATQRMKARKAYEDNGDGLEAEDSEEAP